MNNDFLYFCNVKFFEFKPKNLKLLKFLKHLNTYKYGFNKLQRNHQRVHCDVRHH